MSSHRLRILLIGPVPPPLGGIVRYCQDMIHSELADQHDITLFQDNIPAQYRPQITTAKNTWNIFKRDGLYSTMKVFGFVSKKMLELDRLLRRESFDILHVLSTAGFGFFRNTFHIQLAKRHGVKTVFHLLGQIDDLYNHGGDSMKRLVSYSLNRADVHIVQSPQLANVVRKMTVRPVYPILNGVPTDALRPPDLFAHSMGSDLVIITVGYLGFQKGTYDIIEAVSQLIKQHPNITFKFVGGGEIEHFQKLVASKKLEDRIQFIGVVDDQTRTELLQQADIFLLPSHAEGQPIALLEAIAAGLPVISSTVGSIPEVVKENNGFLVTPGDIEGIVRALEKLVVDQALREQLGRFNVEEAARQYALPRVFDEIQTVYDTLF